MPGKRGRGPSDSGGKPKRSRGELQAAAQDASSQPGSARGVSSPVIPCQPEDPCKGDLAEIERACAGAGDPCANPGCQNAKKCKLSKFSEGCCPGITPHHPIEVHCFTEAGGRKSKTRLPQFSDYDDAEAPCVCVSGSRYSDEHGMMHAIQNTMEKQCMDPDGDRSQMGGKDNSWTYGKAKEAALLAHKKTFGKSGPGGKPCHPACLEKQLDAYHKTIGNPKLTDGTPLRADKSPLKEEQKELGADIAAAAAGGPAATPAAGF